MSVDDLKKQGGSCPYCGQYVKRYWRRLDATMARCLIRLVRGRVRSGQEWLHVDDIGDTTGCLATLRHWGLVEQAVNTSTTKRCSGLWRPTELGAAFAAGTVDVPEHVFLYNNQVEGWGLTRTNVQQSLGNKFNYAELWGAQGAQSIGITSAAKPRL